MCSIYIKFILDERYSPLLNMYIYIIYLGYISFSTKGVYNFKVWAYFQVILESFYKILYKTTKYNISNFLLHVSFNYINSSLIHIITYLMRVAAVHFIPMAFKYTMLYITVGGWGGRCCNKIIQFSVQFLYMCSQNAIFDKIMMEAFIIYLFIYFLIKLVFEYTANIMIGQSKRTCRQCALICGRE